MASRPLVAHTIPQGRLEEDKAFHTGKSGTNLATVFPMAVTREMLERGRERFEIYCAPCHGGVGDGSGMVVSRGYPRPPSYHTDRLRNAPPGYFFNVITTGYGVMYPYASRVKPADRWAITAYIRALQLSQNARITDLPAGARTNLEEKGR